MKNDEKLLLKGIINANKAKILSILQDNVHSMFASEVASRAGFDVHHTTRLLVALRNDGKIVSLEIPEMHTRLWKINDEEPVIINKKPYSDEEFERWYQNLPRKRIKKFHQ